MIRKIDHVAVAVPELEQALSFWSEALGLQVSEIETVETEQVKEAMQRKTKPAFLASNLKAYELGYNAAAKAA